MRRSDLLFNSAGNPTLRFANFLRDIQIPGNDLASINEALQKRFVQKNPDDGSALERWDLKQVQLDCPPERIIHHLDLCGFVSKTIPQEWSYDFAAWPGALVPRAGARLLDLINAWKSGVRWKKTIVFGGKRNLLLDKENANTACEIIGVIDSEWAHNLWEIEDPKTELDMMKCLWYIAKPFMFDDDLSSLPVVFVDAPMKPPAKEGGQPIRPNTEDTIKHWLDSEKPTDGSILVSSGAPYGMAQDEAFRMILEPRGFTLETFGHAAWVRHQILKGLSFEIFMREVAGCVYRIKRSRLG